MKKFAASVVLAACLLAALIVPASAHGASVSPLVTCSVVVTDITGSTYHTSPWYARVLIQELKNSDGTSCNEYRGVLQYHTESGFINNLNYRHIFLTTGYGGSGSLISGSSVESYSTVGVNGTNWVSFNGNWVTRSCNQLSYAGGEVDGTDGTILYAYSTGQYGAC